MTGYYRTKIDSMIAEGWEWFCDSQGRWWLIEPVESNWQQKRIMARVYDLGVPQDEVDKVLLMRERATD